MTFKAQWTRGQQRVHNDQRYRVVLHDLLQYFGDLFSPSFLGLICGFQIWKRGGLIWHRFQVNLGLLHLLHSVRRWNRLVIPRWCSFPKCLVPTSGLWPNFSQASSNPFWFNETASSLSHAFQSPTTIAWSTFRAANSAYTVAISFFLPPSPQVSGKGDGNQTCIIPTCEVNTCDTNFSLSCIINTNDSWSALTCLSFCKSFREDGLEGP